MSKQQSTNDGDAQIVDANNVDASEALGALFGAADGDEADGTKPDGEGGESGTSAAAGTDGDKGGADGGGEGEGSDPRIAALEAQVEAIKAEARKWEERSKSNFKELNALKRASMTDEERAAAEKDDRGAEAREALERAEAAEAKLLRREIVLDLKLSKEDAAILDGIVGDETALRAVAARLAAAASASKTKEEEPKPEKKGGGFVPAQGSTSGASGKRDLGDMFADALGEIL
jgi:hypothetical protein